eukprot:3891710-Amphidinium_carterae.1
MENAAGQRRHAKFPAYWESLSSSVALAWLVSAKSAYLTDGSACPSIEPTFRCAATCDIVFEHGDMGGFVGVHADVSQRSGVQL